MSEPEDPGLKAMQSAGAWFVVLPTGRIAAVQEANSIPLHEFGKDPYSRGYDAVRSQDDCPYPEGSRDAARWWQGFSDAMGDHWYYDEPWPIGRR